MYYLYHTSDPKNEHKVNFFHISDLEHKGNFSYISDLEHKVNFFYTPGFEHEVNFFYTSGFEHEVNLFVIPDLGRECDPQGTHKFNSIYISAFWTKRHAPVQNELKIDFNHDQWKEGRKEAEEGDETA